MFNLIRLMIVFLNCRKNWLLFIQITLFALFECYFIFFQILNLQIDSLHSCHEHTVQNPQFSSLRQTETNDRNPSWGNVHLLFLSVAQSSNWPKILHVKSAKVNQSSGFEYCTSTLEQEFLPSLWIYLANSMSKLVTTCLAYDAISWQIWLS